MSDTSGSGKKRGGLFDDLAGVAGGAFSALAGVRGEVEAAVRSQVDQMVQRLELVKREELDAAMELARRAREAQELLEVRVAALELKLAAAAPPAERADTSEVAQAAIHPETAPPGAIGGTMPNPPPIG